VTVDSPQPAVQRLLGPDSPADETPSSTAPDVSPELLPGRPAAPKDTPRVGAKVRILETAARLFYEEGINSVGVDRLIAEGAVTKATFYKHYGSKDNLIVAYMNAQHDRSVAGMDHLVEHAESPGAALRTWVQSVIDFTNESEFRGCPFLNAAAEYHDSRNPVREIVAAHRDWYTERLADLLHQAGAELAGDAADELLLARDGAMLGAYAGDSIAATMAFGRIADRVLG
jgi:AcrR family transcriptional regulator